MQAGALHDPIEIGVRRPVPTPVAELGPGEVGYLIAGIKDVGEARSGETVTDRRPRRHRGAARATATRSRWCSPGCSRSTATTSRTCATRCEKLKLNDASITYTPESSGALGFGFRCGFLGLLHMEIVKERLEREFGLALIATAPSVEYRVHRTDGDGRRGRQPGRAARPAAHRATSRSRTSRSSIITPTDYTGTLMELCQQRRGELDKLEYLSPERVELHYLMPLAEVVVDFFDQLKSRSQGYASLDYEPAGYRQSPLVKVDLLLNGVPADAFATIVHRDKAFDYGRRMTEKLKELIPRQMFDVPIQAAIGGTDHRPRDRQGQAQGRPRQVLRRRHHPQAQAAREAEGRQEEDEVDRPGRGPRRRVHQRPQARRLTAIRASSSPETGNEDTRIAAWAAPRWHSRQECQRIRRDR